MRKQWNRSGWDSSSWGPPRNEWWSRREGSEAWQQFGRGMARRFVRGLVIVVMLLLALGAFIATAIIGTTSADRWVVVVVTPFIVVGVVALVARYVLRTWRPVNDLITAAGTLADGDYSVRVEPDGSAAIRPVARSFNEMAERLERADADRRRLLADLGHELRTPLAVVQGEIEAMLDGVHDPDPEHLELLLEEVAVMERLLEDLRTLSMAEAGTLELHPEPMDLGDLISDTLDGQRRTAAAAGVDVVLDVDPDLGEVVLDPVRIREVLANLVVNAIRAMPDGGELRVAVTHDPASIVIDVSDTGIGIDPAELEHVFDRFRKGSTSSGSGLGLTISRDLVEAHGGSIEIDSTPGAGTTATVTVPLVVAPD